MEWSNFLYLSMKFLFFFSPRNPDIIVQTRWFRRELFESLMVSCLVLVASLNIKATAKFSVLELGESAEDLFQWDDYLHSVPVNIGHDHTKGEDVALLFHHHKLHYPNTAGSRRKYFRCPNMNLNSLTRDPYWHKLSGSFKSKGKFDLFLSSSNYKSHSPDTAVLTEEPGGQLCINALKLMHHHQLMLVLQVIEN